MTSKSADSRIPSFAALEDEAAFWDSHSVANFRDELTPVEVAFLPGPTGGSARNTTIERWRPLSGLR